MLCARTPREGLDQAVVCRPGGWPAVWDSDASWAISPWGEHWFSDYREVVTGGWFPRATGWALYSTDKTGRDSLDFTCNQEVVEFHVNEPLADELFALPIEPDKDGVEVADNRSGELRMYKVYKSWPSLLGKETPVLAGIDLPSLPAVGRPC